MRQFVHLHLHTQYSLLDGANKIVPVIERAAALGQPAIAMTDHGNLCGAVEFYTAAKKVGIKPIIGCEFYVTPTSRLEKKTRQQGGGGTHHLTVLAMNDAGYKNLCKLSTLAYKEGFYFKPRIDHELLTRYNEGLIVTSGCMAGEFNSFVERDDLSGSKKIAEYYSSTFKDRFYLEIQPHPLPEQRRLNNACIDLAKDIGLPLVATTDCHYLHKEDHRAQEVLMCISTGKLISDPDRLRHDGITLHLKTAEEMYEELAEYSKAEEAISQSLAIADRCNLEFDFKTYYMPVFKTEDPRPLIDIMGATAREGLEKRIESLEKTGVEFTDADRQAYSDRLEFEIALIDKMGFAGYFLVVSDFIVYAKESGIPVGPGRGSCAGSLVSYAMWITELDPIKINFSSNGSSIRIESHFPISTSISASTAGTRLFNMSSKNTAKNMSRKLPPSEL